jgi:hypothetical protein
VTELEDRVAASWRLKAAYGADNATMSYAQYQEAMRALVLPGSLVEHLTNEATLGRSSPDDFARNAEDRALIARLVGAWSRTLPSCGFATKMSTKPDLVRTKLAPHQFGYFVARFMDPEKGLLDLGP